MNVTNDKRICDSKDSRSDKKRYSNSTQRIWVKREIVCNAKMCVCVRACACASEFLDTSNKTSGARNVHVIKKQVAQLWQRDRATQGGSL